MPKHLCCYSSLHGPTISGLGYHCCLQQSSSSHSHFLQSSPSTARRAVLFYQGLWNSSTQTLQIFSVLLRVQAAMSFRDRVDLALCCLADSVAHLSFPLLTAPTTCARILTYLSHTPSSSCLKDFLPWHLSLQRMLLHQMTAWIPP